MVEMCLAHWRKKKKVIVEFAVFFSCIDLKTDDHYLATALSNTVTLDWKKKKKKLKRKRAS